jgi:hypothetical protein
VIHTLAPPVTLPIAVGRMLDQSRFGLATTNLLPDKWHKPIANVPTVVGVTG